MFDLSLFLDFELVNTLLKNIQHFHTYYKISVYFSNGFKIDHHRDIVSEEIHNRHFFIVDSPRLQSVKVDVLSSTVSSASAHTSQGFKKIRSVGVVVIHS